MKIIRVNIDGFKNLMNVEILLDNLIALVSLNNFGKSNLLTALSFGIDFIRASNKGKIKMMSYEPGIPLNTKIASRDYKLELEMSTIINQKKYLVIYGFTFKWIRNDDTGCVIKDEWLKVKLDEKKQKYNTFINRSNRKVLYKSSESGRCNSRIKIEPTELVINKLKAYDDLFYIDIVKRINDLDVRIGRHLDASQSYLLDPFERISKQQSMQIDDGENLPRIVHELKDRYPSRYAMLIDAFIQFFPNICDVNVKEISLKTKSSSKIPDNIPYTLSNKIYFIFVKDINLNQEINFEYMSDGAKRIFLFLTMVLIADIKKTSLIAIEEPENSIHPSLLQSYLRVISTLLETCNVIITSHSPYILQYIDPRNIYLGLPRDDNIAEFKRVSKTSSNSMIRYASKSGSTVGDYIFELLSGSEDDISDLKEYLEK